LLPFGVVEVAEHLAVGSWRIYRLCEDGELPHIRINNSIRVRPKDLEEFIAAQVPAGQSDSSLGGWLASWNCKTVGETIRDQAEKKY
jgi:excisionase family DNA binding protein